MTAAGNTGSPTAAWQLGNRRLTWRRRPLVMGILNLTPDSFYPGSRVRPDEVADQARAMADAGADLLDLGAESSRPGAEPVSGDQERRRLLPALEAVRDACNLPLTVDTYRADTAAAALAAGADGINDITAGRGDSRMLPLVAARGAGLVLMHMAGTPRTMQDDPRYDDVVAEVAAFLEQRAAAAEAAGVTRASIVIDPGIGFGKTLDHNLALLANLEKIGGRRPVLLGASRKSFIGMLTGADVEERLPGSLAAVAAAFVQRVSLVRVHDVGATVQFLTILEAIAGGG